jgi:A/G-specific adenine glycosylase
MEAIRSILLKWYHENKRDLPWRQTDDPYLIWLSEVILQQTRVDQGTPYFLRFTERFPDLKSLALAEEAAVLKEWEGLGYYSRARNLHKAAQQVLHLNDGKMPKSYSDLLKLPGVGPYTAAAIASIAYGEAVPLIDGNVARVLARLFGLTDEVNSSLFRNNALLILTEMIDRNDPGNFNQALMEFGALQCVPASPACISCPMQLHCTAHSEGKVKVLPVKVRALRGKVRYFNYLVPLFKIDEETHTLIRQREGPDIWQHLFEFPLVESTKPLDPPELVQALNLSDLSFGGEPELKDSIYSSRHVLSHQIIEASFSTIFIKAPDEIPSLAKYDVVAVRKIRDYPFSRLILNFLDSAGM